MKLQPKKILPVEIVFHPRWWNRHFGMQFGWDYFFDPDTRVRAEQEMVRHLHAKFGEFGYGEQSPPAAPVIGPVHLAAGFMMSAIWGCKIVYYPDASPQVACRNLSLEELDGLAAPDPMACREFSALMRMIETLQKRFGYVTGDINWYTLQNLALDLVGERLFLAYYDQPEMVHRIYDKLMKSALEVVNAVRRLTGTSSTAVNRSIVNVEPALNLHSNCSVQMISNEQYEAFLLPHERELALALPPYGVHHCGGNMHKVAPGYAKIPDCGFFDVGWGADVAHCRRLLPEAFFNLRLSPVRLQECTPAEVKADIEALLGQVGDIDSAGLCAINMDYGTPDENVAAIFMTAEKYRKRGDLPVGNFEGKGAM